jgi:hypothetical protein
LMAGVALCVVALEAACSPVRQTEAASPAVINAALTRRCFFTYSP